MPHLIIELDSQLDLDANQLLTQLNQVLVDSGHFTEIDIKSRLFVADYARVGTKDYRRAFVHATLRLLPGRSSETQQQLAQLLVDNLNSRITTSPKLELHISAEVIELPIPHYSKAVRAAQ